MVNFSKQNLLNLKIRTILWGLIVAIWADFSNTNACDKQHKQNWFSREKYNLVWRVLGVYLKHWKLIIIMNSLIDKSWLIIHFLYIYNTLKKLAILNGTLCHFISELVLKCNKLKVKYTFYSHVVYRTVQWSNVQ